MVASNTSVGQDEPQGRPSKIRHKPLVKRLCLTPDGCPQGRRRFINGFFRCVYRQLENIMITNINNHETCTEKTELPETTETTENSFYRYSVFSDISVNSDTSVLSVFSVQVQSAAIACTPKDVREVNRVLFDFARRLRGLLPIATVEDLVPYVELWHKAALKTVNTLEWTDVWWDFIDKWDAVKFPAGSNPLELIVQEANDNEPPECSMRYGGKVGRLVHLLQRLQLKEPDKPFYMAGRTAAKLLGVPHPKPQSWLNHLVREGVLEVVSKGTKHRATRYRYLGD